MTATETPAGTREQTLRVTSPDGTEIACFSAGDGPPLLLVHGATASHARWETLRGHLEPHASVHAVDRRGRGASGDADDYAIEREYEDVAAVVDAIAAASGTAVDVLGHSFGGVVAYGAASLTDNVRSLLLYEGWPAPHPDGMVLPAPVIDRMEALLSGGDPEAALTYFMREVVGMPDEELALYRTLPEWPRRVAAAHTLPRETGWIPRFDPELAARIDVPVLLLVGGDSPPVGQNGYDVVADALPDARVVVLEGQQHIAMDTATELFARHVLAFLRERP